MRIVSERDGDGLCSKPNLTTTITLQMLKKRVANLCSIITTKGPQFNEPLYVRPHGRRCNVRWTFQRTAASADVRGTPPWPIGGRLPTGAVVLSYDTVHRALTLELLRTCPGTIYLSVAKCDEKVKFAKVFLLIVKLLLLQCNKKKKAKANVLNNNAAFSQFHFHLKNFLNIGLIIGIILSSGNVYGI